MEWKEERRGGSGRQEGDVSEDEVIVPIQWNVRTSLFSLFLSLVWNIYILYMCEEGNGERKKGGITSLFLLLGFFV